MRTLPGRSALILLTVAFVTFVAASARGDDWAFYSGSGEKKDRGKVLTDWSVLNGLKPVVKTEATTYHYYDRDSVASNSPFPGGIVRVLEKSVLKRQTKSYEETREEMEREEEIRLNREINVLDYAWLFPLAVKRAAKETTTLFEINCDSREFFILEVNQYDKAGKRMTRELAMDRRLWYRIQPGTVMGKLFKEVCR